MACDYGHCVSGGHTMVVRCRTVTSRHLSRRPVVPVLAALLVGATTAATATVMAGPTDALTGERADVAASSFTQVQWPGGGARPTQTRPAAPAPTPTRSDPAPTTTTEPPSPPPAPPPPTTTQPPAPTVEPPPPLPPVEPPAAPVVEAVVALVNTARTAEGCDPLRVDNRLTTAAQLHSEDMSRRNYFSHTTPEGLTFDKRIEEAGYPRPGAENLARGQQTPEDVMEGWMNSDGHRRNILNCELKTIGVGLEVDGFYWTQDFGF
jgi:uncharacterized protein YkwD